MAGINQTKIVKNPSKQTCEAAPVKLPLYAGLYRRNRDSGCFWHRHAFGWPKIALHSAIEGWCERKPCLSEEGVENHEWTQRGKAATKVESG